MRALWGRGRPRRFGPLRLSALLSAAALFATPLASPVRAQAPAFQPRAEAPTELPEGPGRDETFYACTACHNFKLVAAQGMTRAQWDETLGWMTSRHNMAEITGAERDLVLDYLAKHYPPKAGGAPGGWKNPFAQ